MRSIYLILAHTFHSLVQIASYFLYIHHHQQYTFPGSHLIFRQDHLVQGNYSDIRKKILFFHQY